MSDVLIPQKSFSPQIEVGTVGWEDEDVWFERGTANDDGYTLIRVQLFRGRDITKPLKDGIGQGVRLLCHISSGIFRIPKKGMRVYVAVPVGMEAKAGAGVIIATIEKNPIEQFDTGRVLMAFPDDDLIIKARSVTVSDYNDDYIAVSPGGGIKAGTFGGGLTQLKNDKFTAVCPGGVYLFAGTTPSAGLVLGSGQAQLWCGAGMFKINALGLGTWLGLGAVINAASVSIGALASPATPASIFPGMPSTSVFISL